MPQTTFAPAREHRPGSIAPAPATSDPPRSPAAGVRGFSGSAPPWRWPPCSSPSTPRPPPAGSWRSPWPVAPSAFSRRRLRFCAGYGMAGSATSGPSAQAERVEDAAARRADRAKAGAIAVAAARSASPARWRSSSCPSSRRRGAGWAPLGWCAAAGPARTGSPAAQRRVSQRREPAAARVGLDPVDRPPQGHERVAEVLAEPSRGPASRSLAASASEAPDPVVDLVAHRGHPSAEDGGRSARRRADPSSASRRPSVR